MATISFVQAGQQRTGLFFQPEAATYIHAEEIAEVVNAAFAQGDIFRKPGQKRTSKDDVVADIEAGHKWYIIEHGDDRFRKIAAAMLYVSDSPTTASIHMLAAHSDFRGTKKGAELLVYAETIARQQGKIYLNLSIAHTNEKLIKYYETYGFLKTGQWREYFPPDLQREYLREEYQGYNGLEPKLRCIDMTKILTQL